MDNYFEGIDFTKIEISLLIGVSAILLLFIIFPVVYNITEIEELEEEYDQTKVDELYKKVIWNQNEIDNTKTKIISNIKVEIIIQAKKIENARIEIQNAAKAIEKLDNNANNCQSCEEPLNLENFSVKLDIEKEKKGFETKYEIEKEEAKIETERKIEKNALEIIVDLEKSKKQIDLVVYKDFKSHEFQDRILIAFVFAISILIFCVYLSRKGYTSYTSWLEKLANDKLTFDLQLLQHVDVTKLRKFYYNTFMLMPLDANKNPLSEESVNDEELNDKVKKTDVLGWKPINENEKWYSVFKEKIDYRFYELFFWNCYNDWAAKNYFPKGEVGDEPAEYQPRPNLSRGALPMGFARPKMNLYTNPELAPWKNNKQIKKELLKDEKHLFYEIFNEIDIFKVPRNEKERAKVEKLMIRKIQIDLLYYTVMMNFRRGLVKATENWMLADDLLKQSEKRKIDDASKEMDVGGEDLEKTIVEIIENFETVFEIKSKNKESIDEERWWWKETKKEEPTDEKTLKRKEKIENIKEKMNNRNSWNSDDWRAMGSIYYKWREAGRPQKSLFEQFISEGSRFPKKIEVDDDFKEEEASKTISEKFWKLWNKHYKHITVEGENDPTEENWKTHRTIRAVNSLSKSFGYKVKEDSGKAVLFFGVVFGLIIAVALTNSLDIVIEAMQLPENCDDCWHTDWEFLKSNIMQYQSVIILFLCFFPLGILFYHQGTILLSAKAAEQMTLGSNALVFVNFLFILLQAVVVYFLASSIGDVNAFLTLLIMLVTIDAIWVTIFTINDMRDDVRDAPVFIEWIIFDIIIGLFAWIFMINYASTPPILENEWWGIDWIFVMLLAVLSTRAIVDYSYGWKNFWSKFAGAE